MRRGVLAALKRLHWWAKADDGDTERRAETRRDAQLIESELRCTFSDEQLEHIANCASFTRQYLQNDTSRSDQTRADFIKSMSRDIYNGCANSGGKGNATSCEERPLDVSRVRRARGRILQGHVGPRSRASASRAEAVELVS